MDNVCSPSPSHGEQCPSNTTTVCINLGHNPAYETVSFDNILMAWLTIFQTLTTENWSWNMFWSMNATNFAACFYFIAVVILGLHVQVQLVVGVVSTGLSQALEEYNEAVEHEAELAITPFDRLAQEIIAKRQATANPSIDLFLRQSEEQVEDQPSFISKVATCITSLRFFPILIHFVIFANIVVLSLYYHGMPAKYVAVLNVLNETFCWILVVEVVLLILALGVKEYFCRPSNVFDFIVSVLGVADVLMHNGNAGIFFEEEKTDKSRNPLPNSE